jgi:hypothetical protein
MVLRKSENKFVLFLTRTAIDAETHGAGYLYELSKTANMIPIQFLLSTQQSIRSDAKHYSLDTYFFSITLSCACKKSSLAWQIKIQTRSIHFLKLACIVLSNQSPVIQRIYHRIQKSKIRSRCTSSFNKKAIFTVTNDLSISPCPKPRALIPL